MKKAPSKAHLKIFRAVEGAVRNTAHGHPKWKLDTTIARSIAKRATGTLTAEWPDVLAARYKPLPSEEGSLTVTGGCPSAKASWPPVSRTITTGRSGGRLGLRRSPLNKLWGKLSIEVGRARQVGDLKKVEVLIEVLRLIDEMKK